MVMSQIETNIYLIENLGDLRCKYRLYEVKGLPAESDDYDKNVQLLVTTLTNMTKSPCISFKTKDSTLVAKLEGFPELPESVSLVRTVVKVEKLPNLQELGFDALDSLTENLAQRFLQGIIQGKLYNNSALWQPSSGHPFYNKSPDQEFRRMSNDVDLFRGFTFRVIALPGNRIGLCVDVRSKYVSRSTLPTKIGRQEFKERYEGINCVYEYGNRWYEIKIAGLNNQNASQQTVLPDNVSLFDDVHRKAGNFKSQALLALPRDCSVLIYYNNSGEQRNVPSGLCRQAYGTEHPQVSQFHFRTIKRPYIRRDEMKFVVDRNLRDLTFGSAKIRLAEKPLVIGEERLTIPDLEFGKNKILSLRNTQNASSCSLDEFPLKKRELLYSNEAGMLTKKRLDRQYIILPKSVHESFGPKVNEDIQKEFRRLFPPEDGVAYVPIMIVYDDSIQKSIYTVARAIIKAVEENDAKNGFGLVMIPEIKSKRMKKEDELANIVMCELREREIYVSVIHSRISTESHEFGTSETGRQDWKLVSDARQQGKYKGYIRNVVLNKILILNSCWPFGLKTLLNADLIIGIDVKNKTAGFTVVRKNGSDITFYSSTSEQKERLGKKHICSKIVEILNQEQDTLPSTVKHITIHRQGKLFSCEKEGIMQALNIVSKSGRIRQDFDCTFAEIKSTSRIPFRLFAVEPMTGGQKEMVYNPIIGTYMLVSEKEAFVCTTGPPYEHGGTTKPLHVVKVDGLFDIRKIIEDVFYLANLTWTKIDDCSRLPLTIKMNDIRLREFAGEYSRDALEFGEEED
jgi:hypothetical protein